VYGTFFFKETAITGIVYLGMLQQLLLQLLGEGDQEGRIHFQQDSLPSHHFGNVRKYINTCFPGRWIGRTAPIAWPSCSPHLKPLDLFLWGFLKERFRTTFAYKYP
jgi:hypothetical protein